MLSVAAMLIRRRGSGMKRGPQGQARGDQTGQQTVAKIDGLWAAKPITFELQSWWVPAPQMGAFYGYGFPDGRFVETKQPEIHTHRIHTNRMSHFLVAAPHEF